MEQLVSLIPFFALGAAIGLLLVMLWSWVFTTPRRHVVDGGRFYYRHPGGGVTDRAGRLRPEPPKVCPLCGRRLRYHSWGGFSLTYRMWRCDGWRGDIPILNRMIRDWRFDRGLDYTFQLPVLRMGVEDIEDFTAWVWSPRHEITLHGPWKPDPTKK